MKHNASIKKEEINELPLSGFSGEIIIVDTQEQVLDAVRYLFEEEYIGFDTETKPSFAKGVSHKVSLLQLANDKRCYLFRLNKIGIPAELQKLLTSKKVTKIGLSLRDDFSALSKYKRITPDSYIDLQNIVADYGIDDLSLQKIYALLFHQKISKSQRLTNWENEVLSDAQQLYAATDAWATLRIYMKLLTLPKVSKQKIDPNIPVFE